ncbi:MAG: MFS transporter [Gammaproteobacteria bacterium]|nr:MFS transporter [Gammaproteobacteria bacterium]MYE82467.1 MFS transporter [Gammaproteobacteria bacterium]
MTRPVDASSDDPVRWLGYPGGSVRVAEAAADKTEVGGGYAKYVTGVLVIVYVFNFIDRQIVTILAEEIKADLGISDAQIGFLYGTAFAVFYALFGIPLGKLADSWTRKNLISIGLGFWSLMTALSGTARSFFSLAAYRVGVGIGEASASPAAFSMLSDYFPPRLRATVLAIYSSGIYIGAGIGIFIGGWIVDNWNAAYPDPAMAPFGIKGWQAAYFAVGLPGILMAIWVYTLREPRRGQSEGLVTEEHPHPFRETWKELMSVLPPMTLVTLTRAGGGRRVITRNLIGAALIALAAWGLILLTGDPEQWIALGIGSYAAFSWVQALGLRDPATFAMMFRSRAFIYASLGFPLISPVTYAFGAWAPPFFIRVHGVNVADAGMILGVSYAIAGWLGITLGGIASDRFKSRTGNARVWVGIVSVAVSAPVTLAMVLTDSLIAAYVLNFIVSIFAACWVGAAASTVNDLVMPRMRAIASAYYILMATVGLAIGPYMVGEVSDVLASTGMDLGESLRYSLMVSVGLLVFPAVFLTLLLRHLVPDEASRLERARAAGEPVEEVETAA